MYAFKIIALLGTLWTNNVSADTNATLIIKSGYVFETKLDCAIAIGDELASQDDSLMSQIEGVQDTLCIQQPQPLILVIPKRNPRRL